MKDNMSRELDERIRADPREQVMSGLLEANPVEVPNALIHEEALSMQREAMRQFGMEEYDQSPHNDNFTEIAENRLRLRLIILQLIDDNDLEADAEKVKERIEQLRAGYENADEMVQTYLGNPQVISQIEPMVLEDQAVDWITENGSKKMKEYSFQEYMKPQG